MRKNQDLALLLIRLYFGLVVMIYHGIINKLGDLSKYTEHITSMGLPAPGAQAVLSGLAMTLGGALVATGVFARLGALVVLPTVLFAAVWVHRADRWIAKDFAYAYVVAMLAIIIAGPGRYTLVEAWRRLRAKGA